MSLRPHPLVYASALALAALQCKSSDTAASKSPESVRSERVQNTNGHDDKTAKQAPLDDAQIVAITAAANSAEIEQGRLAQERAHDPRVRDFGAMMVDHHGEASQDQQKLRVEPTQGTDSQRMQRDAEDALRSLKQKDGKEFDRAYLQLQIDEHRRVRDELQDKLLPSAKDSGLKAYLEAIKPKVESHLAQAERLQEEMNGTSSLDDKDEQRPMSSDKKPSPSHSSSPH